ncbi:uncharacterized protein LOC126966175 [Leptidea sinapis]|uniref:uncharacterized protein LOC126966175 n=1 Tax=Leptidea sinapis TaxID=189913 RepID=UPI00213F8497|nr:uncharacterized protein LOC126966175 [Leptidea sinapis]
MKLFLIVLATVSLSSGVNYNGLRVRFGWADAMVDKEAFFSIPRTMSEAESTGWQRIEGPPGPLPELMLYCTAGRYVCPLFHKTGFVAGLQIGFPVDDFKSPTISPEKRLVRWHAPATDTEPARDYWTATQYYVSEASLKAGAGPQVENGDTLQDGGVWVKDLEGQLIRIPSTEAELSKTLFKKQNCYPKMGTHYHWNMTREKSCDELLPWFPLVTNHDLIGVGFQIFGSLPEVPKNQRDWFEKYVGGRRSVEAVIPDAPECYLDLIEQYPMVSLHVYYINEPWTIKCTAADSVLPSAIDKL